MSSRSDYRKRERSWERDDRERDGDRSKDRDRHHRSGHGREDGRRRSRSPRRGDRRDYERRDYRRERDDDRRDRGEREHRKRDDRDHEREREYKRERKSTIRREDEKAPSRQEEAPAPQNPLAKFFESAEPPVTSEKQGDAAKDETMVEEGEEMDAVNDDDAGMMAVMGMAGFGSTKGKQVMGNQEGSVNIKKMRTWRQYMNRRGGFNRPLDKIK